MPTCQVTFYLLPCLTYLPRIYTGVATQTLNSQQYQGHMAGGRRIFLPLSMLKMISTGDSQSSLSRSYTGNAGWDAETKERGIQLFKTYRTCVLTCWKAQEWPALRVQLDLSLKGLVEWICGISSLQRRSWSNEMHHYSDRFCNVNESAWGLCVRRPDPHW